MIINIIIVLLAKRNSQISSADKYHVKEIINLYPVKTPIDIDLTQSYYSHCFNTWPTPILLIQGEHKALLPII